MTNLVFAHTHVVELKSSFAWVWYSSADISDAKFHQDQQKNDFEDVEGRNLHSHITLAIGLYMISGLGYISLQTHTIVGRN